MTTPHTRTFYIPVDHHGWFLCITTTGLYWYPDPSQAFATEKTCFEHLETANQIVAYLQRHSPMKPTGISRVTFELDKATSRWHPISCEGVGHG